jgi:hypothetical protein
MLCQITPERRKPMKVRANVLLSVVIVTLLLVCQSAQALTAAQIKQIEEIAQNVASQHNANAKTMLDDVTVSTRAVAIGRNVRLEYVLRLKKNIQPAKLKEWVDATKREIIPNACQVNANNPAFDRGLYYTFTYTNTYGEKLTEFVVDKATCKR